LPSEEVVKIQFDDSKLHHVAAKCGVFAETDIVNLVKSGIPAVEIMNSLADAIVMQNLSVLTRGNTLRPKVLLLGGPNTYLPFLRDCWRKRIPETWNEPRLCLSEGRADRGADHGSSERAVLRGVRRGDVRAYEAPDVGRFIGAERLTEWIATGRKSRLGDTAGAPLLRAPSLDEKHQELDAFREQYRIPKFTKKTLEAGQVVRGVIGMDGGSTSSKAVLIDYDTAEILTKEYQLSKGNPIQDTKEILARIRQYVKARARRWK
jgi:activator of 2-hydroxyglutaryl-CoA dehydratase